MLKSIIKAFENFCIHQISIECQAVEYEQIKDRTVVAYIDLDAENSLKYRVYMAFDLSFIQLVAKLFLDEEDSDDETLADMALEALNIVVGSAKVIAQEDDECVKYNIKTPVFEKFGAFACDCDEAILMKTKDTKTLIAIKELD